MTNVRNITFRKHGGYFGGWVVLYWRDRSGPANTSWVTCESLGV